MLQLIRATAALRADRHGVTAVEYAVIAGVLVAAIGAAFTFLGTDIQNALSGLQL
jgi:Flp pilus assembly pilin Flp